MKKIKLTQGQYALVDDEDFEELNKYKWYASKAPRTFYAVRSLRKKGIKYNILMHGEIMKTPKGMVIDHINGDGLNNQKDNLRICTVSQNISNSVISKRNKTGYKGVSFHQGKYRVNIKANGKSFYLGVFETKEEAHETYVEASKKYHKEFSRAI